MLSNMLYRLFLTMALMGAMALAQLDCPYIVGNTLPRANIRSNLYRGEQVFTVNMLSAIQEATPNENIFFSPYSTYHALLLAYFGATNETEQELIKVLHLDWAMHGKSDVHLGYRVEKRSRAARTRKSELQFVTSDKIYFDKSIHLSDCMLNSFIDELESLDFRAQPEPSRLLINEWINNVTQNEIKDMLSPGDVSPETQVVLANAAYFKGKWMNMFETQETRKEIFYTSVSNHSFVDMMHTTATYNFLIDETLEAHVLIMPYIETKNEEHESNLSMIIILPPMVNNGLEQMLQRLTPDTLERALNESMPREVEVSMPKFEFEQNLELLPILRKMGVNRIFDRNAEFGHFSQEEQIVFGDAKHVAKIKVDEEGSTAAAATVLFSFRSARPVEPTKFECNHPFLFLIYDEYAKAVLFAGIYRKP